MTTVTMAARMSHRGFRRGQSDLVWGIRKGPTRRPQVLSSEGERGDQVKGTSCYANEQIWAANGRAAPGSLSVRPGVVQPVSVWAKARQASQGAGVTGEGVARQARCAFLRKDFPGAACPCPAQPCCHRSRRPTNLASPRKSTSRTT